jgi:hypothetical protein
VHAVVEYGSSTKPLFNRRMNQTVRTKRRKPDQ